MTRTDTGRRLKVGRTFAWVARASGRLGGVGRAAAAPGGADVDDADAPAVAGAAGDEDGEARPAIDRVPRPAARVASRANPGWV